METVKTLGEFLPEFHNQSRDAVHIAVVPVTAGEDLRPGEKLRVTFDSLLSSEYVVMNGDYNEDYIGRADPFIEGWQIKKGAKFWMWLRPGTITGLKHVWTHPTLDGKREPVSKSELWLRQFADKWNFDYHNMIENSLKKTGSITARGKDLHSATGLDPGDEDLFWQHIEALTNRKLSTKHKEEFCWSCTC